MSACVTMWLQHAESLGTRAAGQQSGPWAPGPQDPATRNPLTEEEVAVLLNARGTDFHAVVAVADMLRAKVGRHLTLPPLLWAPWSGTQCKWVAAVTNMTAVGYIHPPHYQLRVHVCLPSYSVDWSPRLTLHHLCPGCVLAGVR
jgi:hypothetical protein